MSIILAGHFEHIEPAQNAIDALRAAGAAPDQVSKFHLNAEGQHGVAPRSGDDVADKGAAAATGGSMAGAALGAVFVGAAVSAVAPPLGIAVGAAVGAYTGSLVGALAKMEDINDVDVTTDVPARKAGIMVAVNVDSGVGLDRISALLKEYGASNVEMWEGRWENGAWSDFDPTSTPHRID